MVAASFQSPSDLGDNGLWLLNETDGSINGIENVMVYLGMKQGEQPVSKTQIFEKKKWLRAPSSGLFNPSIQPGDKVKKGQTIGFINGPFADYHEDCKAPKSGVVISLNHNPMVNRGDAIAQVAFND